MLASPRGTRPRRRCHACGVTSTPSVEWDDLLPHYAQLIALAGRHAPTPADAEDAVHDAFLHARALEGASPENLGGWLNITTRRLCVDAHRRVQSQTRVAIRLAGRSEAAAPADEAVCARSEAEWVAGHLPALPPRQRQALQLRADGRAPGEIAATMGISVKTVESLLGRARTAMRAVAAAARPQWQAGTRARGAPDPRPPVPAARLEHRGSRAGGSTA